MSEKKVVSWFTMNGKHIPIYEGESKDDAVRRSVVLDNEAKKQADIKRNKEEADKLNNKKSLSSASSIHDYKKLMSEAKTKEELMSVIKQAGNHMTPEQMENLTSFAYDLKNKFSKTTATVNTQSEHKKAVAELSKDKYEDGTYDINSKKTVDFNDGYQVTFCQIGDNYSDSEYAKKVNECLKNSSDGKTYAGKFEGTPEISFHWNNRDDAVKYAKANNQISIWDWKAMQDAIKYESEHPDDEDGIAYRWMMCEIKTGGTGRRNK